MIKEKLEGLLNDLCKSDEMSEIEDLRTQINKVILSSKEGKNIKWYLKWNESVDLHVEYIRTRLGVQGVAEDVYHVMDELIHKLYINRID